MGGEWGGERGGGVGEGVRRRKCLKSPITQEREEPKELLVGEINREKKKRSGDHPRVWCARPASKEKSLLCSMCSSSSKWRTFSRSVGRGGDVSRCSRASPRPRHRRQYRGCHPRMYTCRAARVTSPNAPHTTPLLVKKMPKKQNPKKTRSPVNRKSRGRGLGTSWGGVACLRRRRG
jgi:hypothetical protein